MSGFKKKWFPWKNFLEQFLGSTKIVYFWHYASLRTSLQLPSQHRPPGALADAEATSLATSESFLRAMQQQLRRPAVHCRSQIADHRSHSCTEGHMWTREIIVMWRGNMVVMWGLWMWCEKATLLSCEKDTSSFSGRVTFPSGNREKVNFTVRGWVYIILDYGLGIRDQGSGIRVHGSGYRNQGSGNRKLWTVNCEMVTDNWKLGTVNWELRTGNWELGTRN